MSDHKAARRGGQRLMGRRGGVPKRRRAQGLMGSRRLEQRRGRVPTPAALAGLAAVAAAMVGGLTVYSDPVAPTAIQFLSEDEPLTGTDVFGLGDGAGACDQP